MRPNTIVAERQGDLGGVKHAMSFDEHSLAHIMSVLTDLYSDPALAVIREYSTNALDSHAAAGIVKPIEITTPNGMSPFFKIKDFGLGMNGDDIQNIYSKYGASTKRDSDSQVGMLGLGCKSALTYTQQFTLVGIKDGIKTNVAISRTETGAGVMEVISQTETNEPNGVEVIVPSKNHWEFINKSRDFFKYWDEGTVLIDGKQPVLVEGQKLSDSITVVKNDRTDYIVMGNVPYPVKDGQSLFDGRDYRSNFGIVVKVDIGEVNFTPSRESLHYTKKTIETISRIREEVKTGFKKTIQSDIDAQKTPADALKVFYGWLETLGNYTPKGLSYDGHTMTDRFMADFFIYSPGYSRNAVQKTNWINSKRLMRVPVIYGYDKEKVMAHQREKIRRWAEQNDCEMDEYFITASDNTEEYFFWLDSDKVVSWDEVRAVKIDRQRTPRTKVKYELWADGKMGMTPLDEFPKTKSILLIEPKNRPERVFFDMIKKIEPDASAVMLQKHRHEKFKRENPAAIEINEWIRKKNDEIIDALTDEDKIVISLDYNSRIVLPHLIPEEINDPLLVAAILAVKGQKMTDGVALYNNFLKGAKDVPGLNVRFYGERSSIMETYPLLYAFNRGAINVPHAIMYVNAVFAANNKGIS